MNRYLTRPQNLIATLGLFFATTINVFAQPTIQNDPHHNRIILFGLTQITQASPNTNWRVYFNVYVGKQAPSNINHPNMLGTYHTAKDTLIFTPRFGFMKGQTYTAQFHLQKFNTDFQLSTTNTPTISHHFTIPIPKSIATTSVTQIYPSGNILPENLLKFYIHFSALMQRNNTYAHIQLIDDLGQEVDKAFLDVTPELWSPTTQRFTLFFDPGRIKRGLLPHQHLGMALQAGKTYRLVVRQSLKDANGNPLVNTHTKTFSIIASDRTSPNIKKWRVTPPKRNTHTPLQLKFDEPLDHALSNTLITIKDQNAEILQGKIESTHNETQWLFTPNTIWSSGQYTIHINPILEDLAGNQLTRLFDVDMERVTPTSSDSTMILPFIIP